MVKFINYIITQKSQIIELLLQHIQLTFVSIFFAIIIGIPLGILVCKREKTRKYVIGIINIFQAVPSMALLGLLVPILGIGSKPAIMMVVLYSLLPIVKNTMTGILGIDKNMIESARGIGLTSKQILYKIQLPLALPIIMAGIRISSVTAVGLMTLAAFIGAGGLGYLVFSGVQTVNNTMILAGAIPACILALLVDYVLSKVEQSVMSKYSAKKSPKSEAAKKHATSKGCVAAMALIIVFSTVGLGFSEDDTIVIGGKNFSEQLILGNIYEQLIEEYTDYDVETKLNMGTSVLWTSLVKGDVDMYLDYTGTILTNIMGEEATGDKDEVYNHVKETINNKYDLTLLEPTGFNNTYTLAMKQHVANKYNIETYSDLTRYSKNLVFCPTLEFQNRKDGLLGLQNAYGMNFEAVKGMDGSLRYQALEKGDAQVVDAFSTDGLLKKFNLKILEDDMEFFPPYYACPVIRNDTLEKYPDLEEVINKLKGSITEEDMMNMNYQVDEEGKTPESVAHDFLLEKKLINN